MKFQANKAAKNGQIDYQNPELNPRCFVMYVKSNLTGFLCGQRRTDFTGCYNLEIILAE